MKILIVSPLYPPDIAPTALYVKELAKRLSLSNEVSIATYGNIPEEISGVEIYKTGKDKPLITRLINFTKLLLEKAPLVDVIYTLNGPSVELPVSIATLMSKKTTILHIGDYAAYEYSQKSLIHKTTLFLIEKVASARTYTEPYEKPEILPFDDSPSSFQAYEKSWEEHVKEIARLLNDNGS